MIFKYIGPLIAALSIDAFEGLIFLALTTITASTGAIPFVGQVIAGSGIVVGEVIDFSISATFGSGLIFLLIQSDLMKFRDLFKLKRMPLVVGKFIPFVNALPFYTAMTLWCIIEKESTKKGMARGLLRVVTQQNPLSQNNEVSSEVPQQQNTEPAKPKPTRIPVTDIRPKIQQPANDNAPRERVPLAA